MGLSKAALKILLNENKRKPFSGRILTLGRQDVHFTRDELENIAQAFDVPLQKVQLSAEAQPQPLIKDRLSDHVLFKSLGFSDYKSMDYSDFEKADILFDLNQDTVPPEYVGAFDFILDSGTIEHIFHVPNVLNNIFTMLRVGGRIIHISPTSNYVDHGFYMFSPTFFWDFYSANQFEVNSVNLIRHTTRPDGGLWNLVSYTPGCLNRVNYGGLDGAMYVTACIATKTAASTGNRVPQQGRYVRTWSEPVAGKKHKQNRFWLSRMISNGYQSTRPARHAIIKTLKRVYVWNPLSRLGLKETVRY